MYEFKVGDNAVYPKHGVGIVTAIESKEIMGSSHTFYTVKIEETGMKIMVPKNNAQNVGLRPVITSLEAEKVIDILKGTDVKIDTQTWNRRYREYMEKIKTGSVYEIAEVLRDLFLLNREERLVPPQSIHQILFRLEYLQSIENRHSLFPIHRIHLPQPI